LVADALVAPFRVIARDELSECAQGGDPRRDQGSRGQEGPHDLARDVRPRPGATWAREGGEARRGQVRARERREGRPRDPSGERRAGRAPRAGPPAKEPLPAASGGGLDSLLDAVKATQADLGRYRGALERIGAMLDEVLA